MAQKPHPTGHTPSYGVRPDPNSKSAAVADTPTNDELETQIVALQQSVTQLTAEVAVPWYAPYLSRKFLLTILGIGTAIIASPAFTSFISGSLAIKIVALISSIFVIIEGAADLKSR